MRKHMTTVIGAMFVIGTLAAAPAVAGKHAGRRHGASRRSSSRKHESRRSSSRAVRKHGASGGHDRNRAAGLAGRKHDNRNRVRGSRVRTAHRGGGRGVVPVPSAGRHGYGRGYGRGHGYGRGYYGRGHGYGRGYYDDRHGYYDRHGYGHGYGLLDAVVGGLGGYGYGGYGGGLLDAVVGGLSSRPARRSDPDPRIIADPAELVDILIDRMLNHPDDDEREEAAERLGKIGDPRAIPYLEQAVGDEDRSVRRDARKAIRRILRHRD